MELLKKRMRFSERDDLLLLQEVLSQNPFNNPRVWEVIQEHVHLTVGKKFLIRTLKEHLERLIKAWLDKEKSYENFPHVERIYTNQDVLCRDVYDLMIEFKTPNNEKSRKKSPISSDSQFTPEIENHTQEHNYFHSNNTEYDHKVEISPQVLESPQSINNSVTSKRRKFNSQRQGLIYMEKYDRKQADLKKKEIEIQEKKMILEERRLALEEQKMDLAEKKINKQYEIQDRMLRILEKKIDSDVEERKSFLKVVERQEKLIESLISKHK